MSKSQKRRMIVVDRPVQIVTHRREIRCALADFTFLISCPEAIKGSVPNTRLFSILLQELLESAPQPDLTEIKIHRGPRAVKLRGCHTSALSARRAPFGYLSERAHGRRRQLFR